MIKAYEFFVGADPDKFAKPVAKGSFKGASKSEVEVPFGVKRGRYIKLRALSALGGEPFTTIGELGVFGEE